MFDIRTDLALEVREMYRNNNKSEVPGIEVEEFCEENININIVKVVSEEGERIIGKPIGTYITMQFPGLKHYDADFQDLLSKSFAKQLSKIVKINKDSTAMVVGLGNWNITPDALGPRVVSKLMITRHLKTYMPDALQDGINPVCAISPGVLGITGIETAEIVHGTVLKVKPDIIIVIDSLASRSFERVATTIQIGDTGLSPGSGVGNTRMSFNKASMGVPVIAIGVPTVVDGATLANDTLDLIMDKLIDESKSNNDLYKMINGINRNEKYYMIKDLLSPYIGDLVVTPKEIDTLIEDASKVIANGINIALHSGIELKDINRYI